MRMFDFTSKSGSIRSMKRRTFAFGKQRGGASLLTTVILAIVLLGIVGGLTTLSVRELRQASNVEQSNRALKAAEGYVNTLASEITPGTAVQPRTACNADPNSNTPGPEVVIDANLVITCATVSAGLDDKIVGNIDRDQSERINLTEAFDSNGNPAKVAKMTFEWGSASQNGTIPASIPPWPSLTSWGNAPAAVELSYTWWPTAQINPVTGGDDYGLPLTRYLINPGGTVDAAQPPTKIRTACGASPDGGYRCWAGVAGTLDKIDLPSVTAASATPSGTNFSIKLTARYNNLPYQLRFYDAVGNLLKVRAPYATIDVTARSNNLYRRVIAKKELNYNTSISFLDNVLFSGTNICKDLLVGADNKPVNGGNAKNNDGCENPTP